MEHHGDFRPPHCSAEPTGFHMNEPTDFERAVVTSKVDGFTERLKPDATSPSGHDLCVRRLKLPARLTVYNSDALGVEVSTPRVIKIKCGNPFIGALEVLGRQGAGELPLHRGAERSQRF